MRRERTFGVLIPLCLAIPIFSVVVFAQPDHGSTISGPNDNRLSRYSSLSEAVTKIGGSGTHLWMDTNSTITSDLTVPKTIEMKFLHGNVINTNGHALRLDGGIEAGNFQIFKGNGKVIIGNISTTVNPSWWGASPSSAPALNASAISSSLSAMPAVGGSWLLPGGNYVTNAPIVFCNLKQALFVFQGSFTNDQSSVLEFFDVSNSEFRGISVSRTKYDWNSGKRGLTVHGTFAHNDVSIKLVWGFQYGLELNADSGDGIGWNKFNLGLIKDNKYGIYIHESGSGWCNDNIWYGGSFRLTPSIKAGESDSWGVYFDKVSHSIYSNHRFLGPSFEILHNGINLAAGCYNFFLEDPRFESVDLWVTADATVALTWVCGYSAFDPSKIIMSKATRGLTIIGPHDYGSSNFRSLLLDDTYGGITFVNTTDLANTRSQLYTNYLNNGGLVYSNYLNADENLNKGFEGLTPPTIGTYRKNSVVWNSNVKSGQPMGWVAASSGTMGTLSGVTGSTSAMSSSIIVNSATKLMVGQFVNLSDGAGGYAIEGAQVIRISATTVSLSSNSTKTVANQSVTWCPAKWVAMPPYQ